MTVFASELLTEIQQRLGDTAGAIWSGDELDQYIQDGYDILTRQTGCLFDVDYLPDYAFAFNFTADWEFPYAEETSGFYADGPAGFTALWERDYIDNAQGPANHNEHWEYNQGYTLDPNATMPTEISATVELPDDMQDIERSTWNTRRTQPLTTREMEVMDRRFELNKGIVEGYFRDKDGLNRLRKWRVPASAYVVYKFDDLTSPL